MFVQEKFKRTKCFGSIFYLQSSCWRRGTKKICISTIVVTPDRMNLCLKYFPRISEAGCELEGRKGQDINDWIMAQSTWSGLCSKQTPFLLLCLLFSATGKVSSSFFTSHFGSLQSFRQSCQRLSFWHQKWRQACILCCCSKIYVVALWTSSMFLAPLHCKWLSTLDSSM